MNTIIELTIVLFGLSVTFILFYHFPRLSKAISTFEKYPSVSIIIPARNEEKTLPLLLADLRIQTLPAYEIICVDDSSEDETANIVLANGAKLISLHDKPEDWTGKTWACQNGANVATGELLFFLDADVRLSKNGLQRLIQEYIENPATLSVQPYHKTKNIYEQFSLFFNLIQIAANGTALPAPQNLGLYGPVILIERSDYTKIGEHHIARKSVVEDMILGEELKKVNLPYRLFVGDQDISFRMYGDGFHSLFEGWGKNFATGASKTPITIFIMVFFWIASLASVPFQVVSAALSANLFWLIIYSFFYVLWVFILLLLTKKTGYFKTLSCIFYPPLLLLFLILFANSMIKRRLGHKVTWKGREIKIGEKI
jgi:4,4'-diaponeurosporenoate glycosyltransferase